jgi:hypothetical protein
MRLNFISELEVGKISTVLEVAQDEAGTDEEMASSYEYHRKEVMPCG